MWPMLWLIIVVVVVVFMEVGMECMGYIPGTGPTKIGVCAPETMGVICLTAVGAGNGWTA